MTLLCVKRVLSKKKKKSYNEDPGERIEERYRGDDVRRGKQREGEE